MERIPSARAAWLALVGGVACAVAPPVEIDRTADADLSHHRTFTVSAEPAAEADPAYGPSARAAAREALVAALRERGLVLAEPEAPADLRVAVGVATTSEPEPDELFEPADDVSVQRTRTGLRTPVGDVPLGEERRVVVRRPTPGSPTTRERRSRAVVVDVFEAASGRLLWRGSSRDPRSPRRIDERDLRERVRAIALRFPARGDGDGEAR